MQYQVTSSTGSSKDTVVITNAFSSYKTAESSLNLAFSQIQTPISSAETSPFEFHIEEVVGSVAYAIESNTRGVTIRTEPEELTDYDFRTSNSSVFQPMDVTVSTRFTGILKIDNIIQVEYPESLILSAEILDSSTIADLKVDCEVQIGSILYSPECELD